MKKLCVWAVAALLMAACTPKAEKTTDSGLLQSNFQMEVDGKKTDLYTLRNKNNMEVCVTNFGGRIVSVMVPDKDGSTPTSWYRPSPCSKPGYPAYGRTIRGG